MGGFSIIPLAKRPTTSKLIVDSDVDMGEYKLETAAVNDVGITTHITVSPSTVEVHCYQYNSMMVIPPQKDVLFSGSVVYRGNETNPNDTLVAVAADDTEVVLQAGFPTSDESIEFTNIKSLYMRADTNVCYFKAPLYN